MRPTIILALLLSGCSSINTMCELSEQERSILEINTHDFLHQPQGGQCNNTVDDQSYSSKELPDLCLVVTQQSENDYCPPTIDGEGVLIYDPETLKPISVIAFPAPDWYIKDLKKKGLL
ncbi:hypothetical protein NBRC116591_23380 [Sessilibacter corallicola]|uniref:Lipoprotein n=1 Tax=Sessilibacter corallicola TaxID=2904075 RepID=A0ABQ0AAD3_9GAMM